MVFKKCIGVKNPKESMPLLDEEPSSDSGYSEITDSKPPRRQKRCSVCTQTELSDLEDLPLSLGSRLLSWRYVMVLLITLSNLTFTLMKSSMPMAILCMAAPVSRLFQTHEVTGNFSNVDLDIENFTLRNDSLHRELQKANSLTTEKRATLQDYEFTWSSETQGLILSATSFLGVASPLLTSWMESLVGDKYTLTIAWLLAGVLTLMCPLAVRVDTYCLVVVRVAMGLVLSANIPVTTNIIAWWGTQRDKLTMMSIANAGSTVGNVLVPMIAGFLCTIKVDNGWPFIFYVFGGLSLVLCIIWFILGADRPEDHHFISSQERQYILTHRSDMDTKLEEKPALSTIMTSGPVLAYLATASLQRWSKLVISTSLPMFLNDVLQFSTAQIGILVAIINIVRMSGFFLWVLICNLLESYTKVWTARKGCIVFGLASAGCLSIITSLFGFPSTRWLFFFLFLISTFGQGSGGTVLISVPLDMAPRYAASIQSILTSIGNMLSFFGPIVIAMITKTGSPREWQLAWCVIGSTHLLSALIFAIFGEVRLQPWASSDPYPSLKLSAEQHNICVLETRNENGKSSEVNKFYGGVEIPISPSEREKERQQSIEKLYNLIR